MACYAPMPPPKRIVKLHYKNNLSLNLRALRSVTTPQNYAQLVKKMRQKAFIEKHSFLGNPQDRVMTG